MKSLADTSFFLLFERIIREDNPGLNLERWTRHEAHWERTRHSFGGPVYAFTLESFVARKAGRAPWSLLIVREHWWAGRRGENLKFRQWAKPLAGARTEILKWFRMREAVM